ncbi:hypothetical protein S7335_2004 [Synechococcus sp. PCC 7335]|nr:hypothetical protein S7335_2004 [Synechococcus sp. PCC 7335]
MLFPDIHRLQCEEETRSLLACGSLAKDQSQSAYAETLE